MESHHHQAKLTRTSSSLLRSSPSIRSSIHSLSSVNEVDIITVQTEEDEQKKKDMPPRRSSSTPRAACSRFFTTPTITTVVTLAFLTLCSIFFYCYFVWLRRNEIPTSQNLLLALIFIALALYFVSKHKNLIHQCLTVLKHYLEENVKKLGFSRNHSEPVQWFIGDVNFNKTRREKKIVKEGVEFYSNGDFYEGEFHKGRCNGSGVYYFFVKGRYEGDWVDGRYDGYGIESWARGSRYRGQYRQGMRHGFGVYKFYTGDSYAGEWFNGQSHGVGAQTCSDGSCYIGEFKYGVKHGLGCYHFRNGDRYAGEYFGDKIHGFGVYHFANGHCYEGSWHEGRKQGYGMYTFRNGNPKSGEWDADNLKHPLNLLTDAVLRAVQAARKTAENAINLRRVDDQVNKAITAANQAATAARVAAVKAVQNRIDGKFCYTNF